MVVISETAIGIGMVPAMAVAGKVSSKEFVQLTFDLSFFICFLAEDDTNSEDVD